MIFQKGDLVRHKKSREAIGEVTKVKDGFIGVSGYGDRYNPNDWELVREKDFEEIIDNVIAGLEHLSRELDNAINQKKLALEAEAKNREKIKLAYEAKAEEMKAELIDLSKLPPEKQKEVLEQKQAEAKLAKALKQGDISLVEFLAKMASAKGNGEKDGETGVATPSNGDGAGDMIASISPSQSKDNSYLSAYRVYGVANGKVGGGFSSGGGNEIKEKFIHTKDGFILNG